MKADGFHETTTINTPRNTFNPSSFIIRGGCKMAAVAAGFEPQPLFSVFDIRHFLRKVQEKTNRVVQNLG